VAGIRWIVLELGPQGRDEIIDGSRAEVGVVAPDDIEEFFASDRFPGMVREQSQHPSVFLGEFTSRAAADNLSFWEMNEALPILYSSPSLSSRSSRRSKARMRASNSRSENGLGR
jgi:hypothetical protein